MPFGGKYRMIDFSLSNCVNSGIRQILVLTQCKAHSLIQHIQRGWGYLRGELGGVRAAQPRAAVPTWFVVVFSYLPRITVFAELMLSKRSYTRTTTTCSAESFAWVR